VTHSRLVRTRRLASLVVALLATGCAQEEASSGPAVPDGAAAPGVFSMRGEEVLRVRLQANDATLRPAFERLLADAEAALAAEPLKVTDKQTQLPPSGDPHDYYSLSPYWWPDPSQPGGLPYIRRDGETNPDSKDDLDQPRLAALGWRLQTLGLAFYLTGDERFAAGAARQLHAWFLDSATRMNPHLRYAQLRLGIPTIHGAGLIDTRAFLEVIDAIALIQGSASWTPQYDRAVRAWFREFLDWFLTSDQGRVEAAAANNHGSWYDAQAAGFALLLGDTAMARATIARAKERIERQIRADGSQPLELRRTLSLHYSIFNVEALSRLAEMGRLLGIDLWSYEAPSGGSLRRAIDRIATYVDPWTEWPDEQLAPESLLLVLRRAEAAFGDGLYTEAIRRLPAAAAQTGRALLLYPGAAS
jgi:hypothetical protein